MTWISRDDAWPSSELSAEPAANLPKLVVPAYFQPGAQADLWQQLARQAEDVRQVVLNPASGPGDAPDHGFAAAAAMLREAGIAVLGYVDTNYGRRTGRDALADLYQYLNWFDADGVFFDRVAVGQELLDFYATLTRRSREMGARTVVFNHGSYPLEAYAEHADLLGTFEGPWEAYLRLGVPRWTRPRPASTFYHVVYSVPPEHAADAYLLATRRRAGRAYITERGGGNPYDGLPAWGLASDGPWQAGCREDGQ